MSEGPCLSGCLCCICVRTQTIGVVEYCGKFSTLKSAGLKCMCWPFETVTGVVSLRVKQLDVRCEVKNPALKDDTLISCPTRDVFISFCFAGRVAADHVRVVRDPKKRLRRMRETLVFSSRARKKPKRRASLKLSRAPPPTRDSVSPTNKTIASCLCLRRRRRKTTCL